MTKKLTFHMNDDGECWMIENVPSKNVHFSWDGKGELYYTIDLDIEKVDKQ